MPVEVETSVMNKIAVKKTDSNYIVSNRVLRHLKRMSVISRHT